MEQNLFDHLYLADWVACLIGILMHIIYRYKKESDKFQDTEKNFDAGKYTSKNIFDFLFYLISGFGVLIVIGELYTNNPEWFEAIGIKAGGGYKYFLSLFSGLAGSVIVQGILMGIGKISFGKKK